MADRTFAYLYLYVDNTCHDSPPPLFSTTYTMVPSQECDPRTHRLIPAPFLLHPGPSPIPLITMPPCAAEIPASQNPDIPDNCP
jgi:hypothetical protein